MRKVVFFFLREGSERSKRRLAREGFRKTHMLKCKGLMFLVIAGLDISITILNHGRCDDVDVLENLTRGGMLTSLHGWGGEAQEKI